MSMKLSEFNGRPAIYVRWHTKKPQAGDHLSLYGNDDPVPNKQPTGRLILETRLHSQTHAVDPNQTEEWWSFHRVSEYDFQRMRQYAGRSKIIEETHDSLF